MKAYELMIGDWVYNKNIDQNMQVYPMLLPQMFRRSPDATTEDYNFFPVPITLEILEKNGFQPSKYGGYEWRERLYGCMGQSCSNTTPIDIAYDDGHCVVSNPHIGSVFQGTIDYVHELQHALRLCGINKEIIV